MLSTSYTILILNLFKVRSKDIRATPYGIAFIRNHSFSMYAKFSEKLTFLTP